MMIDVSSALKCLQTTPTILNIVFLNLWSLHRFTCRMIYEFSAFSIFLLSRKQPLFRCPLTFAAFPLQPPEENKGGNKETTKKTEETTGPA